MTHWTTLLGDLDVAPGEVLLYLDPHGLDLPVGQGELHRASTRWDVRRIYERHLRHRPSDAHPAVLHITASTIKESRDLPWDLSKLPYQSLDPVLPDDVRGELHQLPAEVAARLAGPGPYETRLASAVQHLIGRAWPPHPDTALATVVRILPCAPLSLRRTLATYIASGPARVLLELSDPLVRLNEIWLEWSKSGSAHPLHADLERAAGELLALVDQGFLAPAVTDRSDLPAALRLARPTVDHLAAAAVLLQDAPPLPDLENSELDQWFVLADWWAHVRLELAAAPPVRGDEPAVTKALGWWQAADKAWLDWLQTHYGAQLSRSYLRPVTVDKVAHYLDHIAVSRGEKALLLVLDGMSLTHWRYLRDTLNLSVTTEQQALAMLPTITSVSRQAIFSGTPPVRFSQTIDRTDPEDRRWKEFWTGRGVPVDQVHYAQTPGRHSGDWPSLPDVSAVGVAVNAIDDLMHGADVNGDHQMLSALATWSQAGLLSAAFAWARRHGHRVWLTADHGSVACKGLDHPIPAEGIAVPSKGLRVRQYANRQLRDASSLPGLKWDPPGYPITALPLMFAPGRHCYRKNADLVSHGGLSLDEVVVPFVEVTP
ncbi:PglZ domain-containing protein [Sphaerisporangium sp. NPDC004334]